MVAPLPDDAPVTLVGIALLANVAPVILEVRETADVVPEQISEESGDEVITGLGRTVTTD
jgi:hypothetical protein